jgi:signal transduction histidine kinase
MVCSDSGRADEGRPVPGPDPAAVEFTAALEPGSRSIGEARRLTAGFLLTRGRPGARRGGPRPPVPTRVRELAQLVVSELVTNACKYTHGPALLRLRLADTAVEIEVWDSEPMLPEAEPADPARIGRHGLEIVQAVTESLVARHEPVGKRITARLPLPGTPGLAPG